MSLSPPPHPPTLAYSSSFKPPSPPLFTHPPTSPGRWVCPPIPRHPGQQRGGGSPTSRHPPLQVYLPPTHPPTQQPTHRLQHLIRTAFSSFITHPPTHPPTLSPSSTPEFTVAPLAAGSCVIDAQRGMGISWQLDPNLRYVDIQLEGSPTHPPTLPPTHLIHSLNHPFTHSPIHPTPSL